MWQAGSVRIARIGGIAVEIHLTFGLVILWSAWQGAYHYGGLPGAGYGILLLVLLFACVLLHELGHGLQARSLGLVVRRITLLPIGGLAQLETPPSHPWHELVIALAGPVVNLGLAALLAAILYVTSPLALGDLTGRALVAFLAVPDGTSLLLYLVAANLVLFVFNMLPAFPMDGGRVLRAGLALAIDYEQATRIAAWLGRGMALLMGVVGLLGWPAVSIPPNPLLLVMALMVFLGARQEESYVRRQRALVRLEVQQIAQRDPETVAPWDPVTSTMVARLLQLDRPLPVLVDGRVVGLVTFHDVRRRRWPQPSMTVAHVMRTQFPLLRLTDTLWVALQEMHAFQLAALPVSENGVFQGLICLDDINHAWRSARRQRSGATFFSGDRASQ